MNKLYPILLLLTLTVNTFSKIDSLIVTLECPNLPNHRNVVLINNDNWTRYPIDISMYDRDSIGGIHFSLCHQGFDSLFLCIDLITLSGANGTKVVENFEDYDLGDDFFYFPLPDRFWDALLLTNGTMGYSWIIEDNSKCLKYGGYNMFGGLFGFIPSLYFGQRDSSGYPDFNYQNWTDYHILTIDIKRLDYTSGIVNKKQNKENNELHIYQNQITKAVYINLPASNRTFNIFMYTMSGKLVNQCKNISTSNFVWRPEGLSVGIYIIKVSR